jgi:uncharacterized membrane protein YfcA
MGHTQRFRATDALGLMLPLLLAGDVIAVWQYRHLFSLRIVRRLLPGSAVGVAVGGLVLWWFHNRPPRYVAPLIKLEVALESIGLVGLHWWRVWRGQHLRPAPGMAESTVVGAAAGASSTLAHAAGPIIALYLLPQRLDRQLFVGTCAIYFFILNTVKLPPYYLNGMFSRDLTLLAAKLLPLVFAGAAFGAWVTRRMNDVLFSKIVYALTFALGWYLLFDSVRALRA